MTDIVERLRQWSEFGYGVEATATMKEAAAEIERLRAALERIASLDVPRPVGHTFRADGVASKHDKCWHGVTMSDECGVCLSNYARAALEGEHSKCHPVQFSDQIVCGKCGLTWDVNDPAPPKCGEGRT